jgi:mevalonate kinase
MTTITCSAPGSVIFMGEYAALAGYPAIAAAIDQRFTLSITPIEEPILDIFSETFGTCVVDLDTLSAPPSYQYTVASFKQFLPYLSHQGFRIYFHANVQIDKQLGMTSAITVALCSAFYHYVHHHLNLENICKIASQAVLSIQIHSSCVDVAASIYGGVIRHMMEMQDRPMFITRVWSELEFFAVYSGKTTSESIAMRRSLMREKNFPAVYDKLHAATGELSNLFFSEMNNVNLKKLGELLQLGQIFLNAYDLHTDETQSIIDRLQALPTVYGAKISGGGLGGCVIGVGAIQPADVEPYELIALAVDDVGVRLDPRVNWPVQSNPAMVAASQA